MAHGQGGAEITDGSYCSTLTCNHEAPICAEVSPTMTAGGAPFERTGNERTGNERTGNERTECEAIIAIRTAQTGANGHGISEGAAHTLDCANGQAVAVGVGGGDVGFSLRAQPSHSGDKGDGGLNCSMAIKGLSVRRLTPVECERLMGFPDNYTRIAWRGKAAEFCPDGPRYKALGNSWAVNCARWIGRRIEMVEGIEGNAE